MSNNCKFLLADGEKLISLNDITSITKNQDGSFNVTRKYKENGSTAIFHRTYTTLEIVDAGAVIDKLIPSQPSTSSYIRWT